MKKIAQIYITSTIGFVSYCVYDLNRSIHKVPIDHRYDLNYLTYQAVIKGDKLDVKYVPISLLRDEYVVKQMIKYAPSLAPKIAKYLAELDEK